MGTDRGRPLLRHGPCPRHARLAAWAVKRRVSESPPVRSGFFRGLTRPFLEGLSTGSEAGSPGVFLSRIPGPERTGLNRILAGGIFLRDLRAVHRIRRQTWDARSVGPSWRRASTNRIQPGPIEGRMDKPEHTTKAEGSTRMSVGIESQGPLVRSAPFPRTAARIV